MAATPLSSLSEFKGFLFTMQSIINSVYIFYTSKLVLKGSVTDRYTYFMQIKGDKIKINALNHEQFMHPFAGEETCICLSHRDSTSCEIDRGATRIET